MQGRVKMHCFLARLQPYRCLHVNFFAGCATFNTRVLPIHSALQQPNRFIFSLVNGWFKDENTAMNKAVSHAEKVIGFPTSYLSLRALLSDELSSIALHIRKLARSKHPLVTTASGILVDSKHTIQSRGLVVLLLSKVISAGWGSRIQHFDTNEAFQSQRSLSELTELIYISFLIHRGIVDRKFLLQGADRQWKSEMELGNKMAVLSGDFLLANACVALAELKNSKVISLMGKAIGDMSRGYFMLPESGEYCQISSLENIPCSTKEWEDVVYLAHGSLLSNACESATELVEEGEKYGKVCADFAKHMTLAHQARLDIQRVSKGSKKNGKTGPAVSELCALPVSLAAEEYGGRDWLKGFVGQRQSDSQQFYILKDELISAVSKSSSAFERSEEVCAHHRTKALECLHGLPDGDARQAVELLTNAFSSV